jgi:hypothetical protein
MDVVHRDKNLAYALHSLRPLAIATARPVPSEAGFTQLSNRARPSWANFARARTLA